MTIKTDESVLIKDVAGTTRNRIFCTFFLPTNPDIIFYQYQIKIAGADTWQASRTAPINDGSLSIFEVEEKVAYSIRVRHVDKQFKTSEWLLLPDTIVIGKSTPPPDVPVISIENANVQWKYDVSVGINVPLDFAGFQLRYAFGNNRIWEQMSILSEIQVGTSFPVALLPAGSITVAVKAIDTAGNQSTNAVILLKDFGDPLTSNIVATFPEDPTFPGLKTNGTVIANELVADDNGSIFWNANPNALFWASPAALFWTTTYLQMQYYFTFTPPFSFSKPFKLNLDYLIEGESFMVEYRAASGAQFWDSNPNALFWNGNPNALFWSGGPSQWLVFPQGGIDGFYQQYEFRITTGSSVQTRGKIKRLRVLIDMPDLTEVVTSYTVPLAGGRIPVSAGFRFISNITSSIFQDVGTPTAFQLKIVDTDPVLGPLVRMYDDKAVAVSGRISAVLRGY